MRTAAFRVSPNALQGRPRCLNRTGWNKLNSQRTCNDSDSVELERHKQQQQQSESKNISKTIFVELSAMWQSIAHSFRRSLNSHSQIWAFKAAAYLGPNHAGALRPALVPTPHQDSASSDRHPCLGVPRCLFSCPKAFKRAKLNSLTRTTAQYVCS